MIILLYLLFAFNMIDTYCTMYICDHGGIELNPIVNWLLQWPMAFILTKIFVFAVFAAVAWKLRKHKMAYIMTLAIVIPYFFLASYYIILFVFFL